MTSCIFKSNTDISQGS